MTVKGQSLFLYLKSAHSQFYFVFRIRQLAGKLNIVPATVLAYEQERFPIPYDIAVLLAEELQVSESLLFDDSLIIESILG